MRFQLISRALHHLRLKRIPDAWMISATHSGWQGLKIKRRKLQQQKFTRQRNSHTMLFCISRLLSNIWYFTTLVDPGTWTVPYCFRLLCRYLHINSMWCFFPCYATINITPINIITTYIEYLQRILLIDHDFTHIFQNYFTFILCFTVYIRGVGDPRVSVKID